MVLFMTRDPRTIEPGGKSVFKIDMDEGGRALSDIEISFEVEPKDAGSMEPEKVKTDTQGSATATLRASPKIDKAIDVLVRAKWKLGGQDKSSAMLVEVRPKPSKGKKK